MWRTVGQRPGPLKAVGTVSSAKPDLLPPPGDRIVGTDQNGWRLDRVRKTATVWTMSDTLVINEVFCSLQGESTWAGWPCVFVRTTGCHLRCAYCDTAYAFTAGRRWELTEILAAVTRLAEPYGVAATRVRLPLVEITGGEPLLQAGSLTLMRQLCDQGFTVLLETSGALDIRPVDRRVHRIVDLKGPSSGEGERNLWSNLEDLRPSDELKCVLATREDYAWAKSKVSEHALTARCPVLFSWATPLTAIQQDPSLRPFPPSHTPLTLRELAELILADALPVRFQLQQHKRIWPPDQRGV